jgi:hypothetical protein
MARYLVSEENDGIERLQGKGASNRLAIINTRSLCDEDALYSGTVEISGQFIGAEGVGFI